MAEQAIVWLTGGSAGIGADLCSRLLASGHRVVTFARREPQFTHANLHAQRVDLTDMDASTAAFRQAAERWPATRIIHNAGAIREKFLEEVSAQDLDDLSHLHLGTAIAMVQANLQHMKDASFGRIILMSTRAIVGLEKRTVYSATKAGMIGMGRTWSLELAAHGITVNMIAPGPIEETEMFHEVVPKDSEQLQRVSARVPVGRVGRPADVSRAVEFFLSDEADFITGQTLFVCGGTSVGSMSFT